MAMRKAAGWLLFGAAIARPMGVVLSGALARILGPGDFGLFGVVITTAGVATSIGTLGLQVGIQRHVARNGDPATLRIALITNAFMALVVSAVLVIFWRRISSYLGIVVAPQLFWLLAMVVFLQVVLAAHNGIIAGASAFRALASQGIQLNVASVALGVPLALYAGVDGAVLAICVATLGVTLRPRT
jgi:O-antigen/teichoic acid export membrane protein